METRTRNRVVGFSLGAALAAALAFVGGGGPWYLVLMVHSSHVRWSLDADRHDDGVRLLVLAGVALLCALVAPLAARPARIVALLLAGVCLAALAGVADRLAYAPGADFWQLTAIAWAARIGVVCVAFALIAAIRNGKRHVP